MTLRDSWRVHRAGETAIQVELDHHSESTVYTSGSTISGHASITTLKDVPFRDIKIELTGTTFIQVSFVQHYPIRSTRPFLRLVMPISNSHLPESRILQAGVAYRVPFVFRIPWELPIGTCGQHCSSSVKHEHLQVPPSVGSWEADDMAPETAQIHYTVMAHVCPEPGTKTGHQCMESHQRIRVLPFRPETAPLDIEKEDTEYSLTKTKTIRKGVLFNKLGYLRATAKQPRAIKLTNNALTSSASSLTANMEFFPTSKDTPPPQISFITAKIRSNTYYSISPIINLPNLKNDHGSPLHPVLAYSITHEMSIGQGKDLVWEERDVQSGRLASLGSNNEQHSIDLPTSLGETKEASQKSTAHHYTTTFALPFMIPSTNTKMFLPTFHSCLMSRSYTMVLDIAVGPLGALGTVMSLAIPLQIAAEGSITPDASQLPGYSSMDIQTDQGWMLDPSLYQAQNRCEQFSESRTLLPCYEDHI